MRLRSRGWNWLDTVYVLVILFVFLVAPTMSMILGNWRLW